MKTFWKNGKQYTHYETHKANSRKVLFDVFKKFFEEENKRKLNKNEAHCFTAGFNMGYKEARKRSKKEVEENEL